MTRFRYQQVIAELIYTSVTLQMYDCPPTAFKEQFDKVQEQKKRAAGGAGADQDDDPMQGTSS